MSTKKVDPFQLLWILEDNTGRIVQVAEFLTRRLGADRIEILVPGHKGLGTIAQDPGHN
ncbi:MAG: hypothetical protein ACE5HE_00270 [Phycisphaerae bacterium]